MMHRIRSLALTATLALLPGVLQGAVVIDDDFDDRSLTTNANGVGTGFTGATTDPVPDSVFVESGTLQTVLAMVPAGANIMGMASNDTFDFFNAGGATITWDVHHYAQVAGSFRLFVGVGDTQNFIAGTVGTPFLTDEAYVWVQISTADDSLGAGMQGALLVDKTGEEPSTADVLATWNWNSFDGISPLKITMDLDQEGYDVSFDDGTANVTGSWGGYFSETDWIGGARAIASAQSATTGRLVLDRVQVNTNEVVAGDADFNNDDVVDGADFLIWQRGLGLAGQTDNSNGDANANMIVEGDDLAVWQAHFGQPNSLPAITSVPEPASLTLLLAAVASVAVARRRVGRGPARNTRREPLMSGISSRSLPLLAALMIALISSDSRAAVVIDDSFDDGDLAINANGVGTGFNLAFTGAGSTTVNSGTLQALLPVGANIMGMASKDTFNFFNAAGATVVWDVHHYVAPQPPASNSYRTYVGVGDGPGNLDASKASPFLTSDAYVWVQLKTNDVEPNPPGSGNQGALLVDKAGGGDADVLAQWDWADFDGFSPIRITMNLNQTGYDISFTDGTPSVTGDWNGYFSTADWNFGARAIASAQSNDFGRLVLDRVQVDADASAAAIPEPASWMLLGAALWSLGVVRKHARFSGRNPRAAKQGSL